MQRFFNVLVLVIFAVFITAPALALLAGVKNDANLQNRTLTARPTLTMASIASGDFGRQFSDWVWDTVPLRAQLLRLDHRLDYFVFKDSPASEVILGKEGFNWRRDRIGRRSALTPQRMDQTLDKIEKAFAIAETPLHLVVSPMKGSIYPEYLPDAYRLPFEESIGAVEKGLRQRSTRDPRLVELWTPFLVEKERLLKTDPATLADPAFRYLWRRNDDHWNVEAGRLQAQAIVEHIVPGAWDERFVPTLLDEVTPIESELSRIYLKLDQQEPYRAIRNSALVELTRRRSTMKGTTGTVLEIRSRKTSTNTPAPLSVLVVRDSFLSDHSGSPGVAQDAGFTSIAPFFDRVVFVHWDSFVAGPKALEPLLGAIDHVVVQIVQSNVSTLAVRTPELVELAAIVQRARRKAAAAATAPTDPPGTDTPGTDPP